MITFEQADKLVDDVEAVLNANGIVIEHRSPLERSCLAVRNDYEKCLNLALVDNYEDFRPAQRETMGIITLFSKILHCNSRGRLAPFLPHLRKLSNSIASQAVPYPEGTCGVSGSAEGIRANSDKMFELFVGLAASEVGDDVCMDSPESADG